jgi:hypothetical protein
LRHFRRPPDRSGIGKNLLRADSRLSRAHHELPQLDAESGVGTVPTRRSNSSASIKPFPSSIIANGPGAGSGCPRAIIGTNAEDISARLADLPGPALRRCRLTLGGVFAGIASVDCEIGQEIQATPQSPEGRMVRQEKFQQRDEIMGLWQGVAQFLQQRFEELLGRLLAMEAALIVE